MLRPDVLIFMVPIVAIVMGIGIGMLAIFLNYLKRKEMFALYHQERMAAIDKGIDLPPLPEDFFHEEVRTPRRSSHGTLLGGLIMLFIGLTLYVALHFTVPRTDTGGDGALYALIPTGVGVACLIYYFTVGRKIAQAVEEERRTRMEEPVRPRSPSA
ncbi:MAG TPA: DUF6249 domain-containing protein [Verrucomicrobiae bacterium]|nr:DUF6249 domain-containing protein [Verrucomicrobiae bacterium]